MKWKAEYSIGLGTIDRQHKEIFQCLLNIENSLQKKDPWHVVRALTAELADCLNIHFAVEEALLEIVNYPNLEDHRAAHEKLTGMMQELEGKIRRSKSTSDLVAFFEAWFLDHVLKDDRAYAAYVREKLQA